MDKVVDGHAISSVEQMDPKAGSGTAGASPTGTQLPRQLTTPSGCPCCGAQDRSGEAIKQTRC